MIDPRERTLYHLYPLSWGSPEARAFAPDSIAGEPGGKGPLADPAPWADHVAELGCNTLLLGPVWESGSHGYDTRDWRRVDRRIGSNEDLVRLVQTFHTRGIDVVLDGVFNHSDRQFGPFRDLTERRHASDCRSWYKGVDLDKPGPWGMPFTWSGWHGHMDLPEFDLAPRGDGSPSPAAAYLRDSATGWIRDFGIDGLRLDAADCLHPAFVQELGHRCRNAKPGFWIMGELIHGNYGAWARECGADSVTNYELWKGLWSAHNDRNYHEIAWTLQREFGPGGTCQGMVPQNFMDNHDTSRLSSLLADSRHLYPVHALAFTLPGIPSVWGGSETGREGKKENGPDWNLRPPLSPEAIRRGPHPDLARTLTRLAGFRRMLPALTRGDFALVDTGADHLAFVRSCPEETLLVVVNAHREPGQLALDLDKIPLLRGRQLPGGYADLLNRDHGARVEGRKIRLETLPCWAQVYRVA